MLQLDFLSEAELMKRFDHKNIVKLLGVCTRGEPVYAVMEFMLHGLSTQCSRTTRNIYDHRFVKSFLTLQVILII